MTGQFNCVADADGRTLVMTQMFDACQRDVFEAWTTPEQVTQWWDPSGKPLASCEIDLRPGGAFRWTHHNEGGAQHSFAGIYREIVPHDRLVFDVAAPGSGAAQHAVLLFTPRGDRTELTMTIDCGTAAQRSAMLEIGMVKGTQRTLENLHAYLECVV